MKTMQTRSLYMIRAMLFEVFLRNIINKMAVDFSSKLKSVATEHKYLSCDQTMQQNKRMFAGQDV